MISVTFTESRIRRNASVARRAGGGSDLGFIWENLLCCISGHLRVGRTSIKTGLALAGVAQWIESQPAN